MAKKSQVGFTLIELLLVMAILALATSLMMVSLPANRGGEKPPWARAFEHRFTFAADMALLAQKQLGVQFSAQAVRFLHYQGEKWEQADARQFAVIELPEQADVAFYLNHKVHTLKRKFEKVLPQVLLDNSLEYIPFELRVRDEGKKHVFKLSEVGEFSYEVSE